MFLNGEIKSNWLEILSKVQWKQEKEWVSVNEIELTLARIATARPRPTPRAEPLPFKNDKNIT